MAEAVKFTFDNDFASQGGGAAPRPARKHRWNADEVEALKSEAFEEGRRAAEQSADAETARAAAAAFDALSSAAMNLAEELQAERDALAREAAGIALSAARKIAGRALSAFPLKAIEGAIEECLSSLPNEPHLVLRVAPDLVEAVKPRLDAIGAERGFAGKLMLLGDPEVEGGDCRIEWADGDLARDEARQADAIAEIIDRHLKTQEASPSSGKAAPGLPNPE